MHLKPCVTSFVLAETRPISSKRFHSLTLCSLCWNRKSDRCTCSHSLNNLRRGWHTSLCFHRQECVEQLLQNMFSGERTESCIVSGIQVLLTLLEIRRPVWVTSPIKFCPVWITVIFCLHQPVSFFFHVFTCCRYLFDMCFLFVFLTGWMVLWMLRDLREVILLTAVFCWPSSHTWYTSTSYFWSRPR